MGRPLTFGSNIGENTIHPCPEIVSKPLQKLRIGDIVRFNTDQEVVNLHDIAPLQLRRQASTYGFSQIEFRRNEYYIVAHRYMRDVELHSKTTIKTTVELNMLVMLPLCHAGENKVSAILTWLVDSAGWIRTAEDFSKERAITGVKVIGTIYNQHPLIAQFNNIGFNRDGECLDGKLSVFESNCNSLINISKILIPFA